ncbi:MAG: hypothetical protein UR69_C0002G0174 [Candidatus Moranbacteria bacterium GW2011_GWE2_35_2-]|nr:MAG: hypothetical protein UR69_C0002G0174 [Candidatus Moranbacteria bacterium GW2011_GWE2_35_2-]KKQ22477.1 MAG: hypothetical protein US37_C0002G0102 [Candidatus Moranbacteria bacterium GW2011_GWF2_37_11]KKQ29546.1 MAG: hypothetical protein US44_C0001G0138 [Candidatus Moranbacteria bacterium GW2011_GWD1_37_17]KKQ30584.1 MAG: hypothetical protein US47_C0002G0174 [Candidatus Moranbacteria bacterium GW2011_GWE1_37_24]KKQ48192.1 MAG: hypothetical protein US66_C0001G0056 [Candidatus Moranbacteria 
MKKEISKTNKVAVIAVITFALLMFLILFFSLFIKNRSQQKDNSIQFPVQNEQGELNEEKKIEEAINFMEQSERDLTEQENVMIEEAMDSIEQSDSNRKLTEQEKALLEEAMQIN